MYYIVPEIRFCSTL